MSNDLQIEALLRENESLRERNKTLELEKAALKMKLLTISTLVTGTAKEVERLAENEKEHCGGDEPLLPSPVDASKTYRVSKPVADSESESLYQGETSNSLITEQVKEQEASSEPLHAAIARTAHQAQKSANKPADIPAQAALYTKAVLLAMVTRKLRILKAESA